MSYRNILVHIDDSLTANLRAEAACHVAARFNASLTGLFFRSDFVPAFVAGDGFSAVTAVEAYVEERDRNLAVASKTARTVFEAATARQGIEAQAHWLEVNGDDDKAVLAAVRRFDLTIFPHVAASTYGTHAISASHVGMSNGGPVLVLPERGYPVPFGRKVLVAWKESRESARALRDAWPFLTAAEEVHFLTVSPNAPDDFDDVQRRNLVAHGCRKVFMHADHNDDVDVSNAIQRHAGRVGADLVVLGLYGHSRMQELLLGGVSRDLLHDLTLPMLVSH